MSNSSNKNTNKNKINKVEEPTVAYNSENEVNSETELHPVLIQLLEKSIKEADIGKTFTSEEVMKLTKEKYPFLK